MTRMGKCHEELTDGIGKCSVPMWSAGCPAGFCNNDAFGFRPKSRVLIRADQYRPAICEDGRYSGYVPGLACPVHGGPKRKDLAHKGDPCEYCGNSHDEVEAGPCPKKLAENIENKG